MFVKVFDRHRFIAVALPPALKDLNDPLAVTVPLFGLGDATNRIGTAQSYERISHYLTPFLKAAEVLSPGLLILKQPPAPNRQGGD